MQSAPAAARGETHQRHERQGTRRGDFEGFAVDEVVHRHHVGPAAVDHPGGQEGVAAGDADAGDALTAVEGRAARLPKPGSITGRPMNDPIMNRLMEVDSGF